MRATLIAVLLVAGCASDDAEPMPAEMLPPAGRGPVNQLPAVSGTPFTCVDTGDGPAIPYLATACSPTKPFDPDQQLICVQAGEGNYDCVDDPTMPSAVWYSYRAKGTYVRSVYGGQMTLTFDGGTFETHSCSSTEASALPPEWCQR